MKKKKKQARNLNNRGEVGLPPLGALRDQIPGSDLYSSGLRVKALGLRMQGLRSAV